MLSRFAMEITSGVYALVVGVCLNDFDRALWWLSDWRWWGLSLAGYGVWDAATRAAR